MNYKAMSEKNRFNVYAACAFYVQNAEISGVQKNKLKGVMRSLGKYLKSRFQMDAVWEAEKIFPRVRNNPEVLELVRVCGLPCVSDVFLAELKRERKEV